MKQQEDEKPLDLEGLVALAAYTMGTNALVKWQVRTAWRTTTVKFMLESQGRHDWRSSAKYLFISDELAEMLRPLFKVRAHEYRSRSWLTLAGICKRLGHGEVSALVKAAEQKAAEQKAHDQLVSAEHALSDACVAFKQKLVQLFERTPALATEVDATGLAEELARVISNTPYHSRYTIGAAVTVPAADGDRYSHRRPGLVLGTEGRTVRVDTKQDDGTAKVETFDTSDVQEQQS